MKATGQKTILILDDDKMNRAILADILEDNFAIVEATNVDTAKAALEHLGDEIQLILVDMFLLHNGCWDFIREIKSTAAYANIPILMIISPDTGNSYLERACELGVVDFIKRPFSKWIVNKRVYNTIRLYEGQNAPLSHETIYTDSDPSATTKTRTMDMLEEERLKCEFFSSLTDDIWFEYAFESPQLRLSRKAAAQLDIPRVLPNPFRDDRVTTLLAHEQIDQLREILHGLSAENTFYEGELQLDFPNEARWFRLSLQIVWSVTSNRPVSAFGLLTDMDGRMRMLEKIETITPDRTGSSDIIVPRFTMEQLGRLMAYFKQSFAAVRLVDPVACMQFAIDAVGKIIEKPYRCYMAGSGDSRCAHCLALTVAHTHKPAAQLEFVNNEIYRVAASEIAVDGQLYVLELVSQVDHEMTLSSHDEQHLLNTIALHNRELYIDPVTGVYNRRYYNDRLRDLTGEFAIAMVDMDNFKQINDTYGHLAGDAALAAAAHAIKANVKSTDDVVRFGGDEFFLLFKNMPKEVLMKRLQSIRHAVEAVKLSDYPHIHMTISIGGAFVLGKMSQILRKADMAMYQAKTTRNNIAIYGE